MSGDLDRHSDGWTDLQIDKGVVEQSRVKDRISFYFIFFSKTFFFFLFLIFFSLLLLFPFVLLYF
jgi:hypothetical protein